MKKKLQYLIDAVTNSYAILFFSQNRVLGALLLVVTFFNLSAGITGLICVLFSIAMVSLLGYSETIKMGLYSFNSLLLGIGFGTFYHFNTAFWVWLGAACMLSIIITITLSAWLGKYGLPVLSLPFILSTWILLLAANGMYSLGLDPKSSYLLEEVYSPATGTPNTVPGYLQLINIHMPFYPALFFRALSAVLFQNNIITGLVMSIGLLIHSRIGFSLSVLGFITACLFNAATGAYPEGISYYHLGANFMMVSCAIGGFFLVPSVRSYLWAVISIPVAFLLGIAFTKVLLVYNLPILSLPFCAVTLSLLYFFLLRITPGKLQLTPLQHYSPERNLYQYLNGTERLQDLKYRSLNLPFMGTWAVSQGYDGDITHKEEWGQALDFVIKDEDGQSFKQSGTRPEHYYCYNKPVLACADGVVETIIDNVDDNEIGEVNTTQNWGNTIVIKHTTGLYSKASHLKKNSLKVKPGDAVKQGEVLALCGNSGRSPVPHLHFQVQATPYIGSKTLAYPFAYYISQAGDNGTTFNSFSVPADGEKVNSVDLDLLLKKAFSLQPGYTAKITSNIGDDVFEVYTDAYNQTCIYSKQTGATAYFINNGTVFYFTSFYGDRNSLLYHFYLAAYKVIFTSGHKITANDVYPLQLLGNSPKRWLQDVVAPFFQFIQLNYQSNALYEGPVLNIRSAQFKQQFGNRQQIMEAAIQVADNTLQGFTVNYKGKRIEATWHTENIFYS